MAQRLPGRSIFTALSAPAWPFEDALTPLLLDSWAACTRTVFRLLRNPTSARPASNKSVRSIDDFDVNRLISPGLLHLVKRTTPMSLPGSPSGVSRRSL